MLKKRYRLKSRGIFKRTLAAKRLASNGFFAVYGLLQQQPQPELAANLPQFGLIASKKLHKRANKRNRLKRQFREIIRQVLLVQPPYAQTVQAYRAIVIILRSESLSASFSTLRQRLCRCLETL